MLFLDEIWKAGPAIQNSLLTVLNEKIYLNGNNELHLPTKAIIAASNELPAEGEGLEALWDRFLIRYIVEPIRRKDNFFRLLDAPNISNHIESDPISDSDYREIVANSATVDLPKSIKDILFTLRSKIIKAINKSDSEDNEADNLYVSDRRWKKAVGVMKTSAYLNGRSAVDLGDILLLDHILWNADKEIGRLRDIIVETIVSSLFADILANYKKIVEESPKPKGPADEPFSPDGVHYIVQCDDFTLTISSADYAKVKRNPQTMFFGSETTDGRIVIRERGQYTVRFTKPGYISLNSYNYPLVMNGASYQQQNFFRSVNKSIETLTADFNQQISANLFVRNAAIIAEIKKGIKELSKRFQHPEPAE